MKRAFLRILASSVLFSLISGIIVLIIGLRLGWKTSTQFSDGFFWAGAILISLGLLSVLGRLNQPDMRFRQSDLDLDLSERTRQWAADISRGHNALAFLGTAGLLLLGLSGLALLVGRLFLPATG
jgi:hypothetical protein